MISKHSVVRSWVNDNFFQFGCLLETRVKENTTEKIASKVFIGWSASYNYECHHLGQIWVVWKDSVRLTPVYKSSQIITCLVCVNGDEEYFFCLFVYASNFEGERRVLWDDLKDHHNSPMFRAKKWLVFGYFNEILSREDHSNVNYIVLQGMRDF